MEQTKFYRLLKPDTAGIFRLVSNERLIVDKPEDVPPADQPPAEEKPPEKPPAAPAGPAVPPPPSAAPAVPRPVVAPAVPPPAAQAPAVAPAVWAPPARPAPLPTHATDDYVVDEPVPLTSQDGATDDYLPDFEPLSPGDSLQASLAEDPPAPSGIHSFTPPPGKQKERKSRERKKERQKKRESEKKS